MDWVGLTTAAGDAVAHDGRARSLVAAIRTDRDASSCALHGITLGLLVRRVRAAESRAASAWDGFLDVATTLTERPDWPARVAVLANLTAFYTLDDPRDYADLATLVADRGHPFVSSTQDTLGRRLEADATLPGATGLIWQLTQPGLAARLRPHVASPEEVVRACEQAALWLFLADLEGDPPDEPITTLDQFRRVLKEGSIVEWRRHFVHTVLDNPWSPAADDVAAYADGLGEHGTAASRFLELYRRRFEDREREVVAREIKRMVRQSGISQRAFAQLIGTSPSRLSTYVNGGVTPSAAMLLRITRVARSLRDGQG